MKLVFSVSKETAQAIHAAFVKITAWEDPSVGTELGANEATLDTGGYSYVVDLSALTLTFQGSKTDLRRDNAVGAVYCAANKGWLFRDCTGRGLFYYTLTLISV